MSKYFLRSYEHLLSVKQKSILAPKKWGESHLPFPPNIPKIACRGFFFKILRRSTLFSLSYPNPIPRFVRP
jgi:hypothetical protein